MACKPCAERRRILREKLLAKTKARKHVQAAAISAVLVASEAVGKVLGIGEDTEDGNQVSVIKQNSTGSEY
jgi:hypothetical protein